MLEGFDLSPREQKFIEIYNETGNAGKAKIEAGYSPNTATSEVLKNKSISKALSTLQRDMLSEIKANAGEALDTLMDIMRNEDASFKVRADVAMNILDRAGFKAADKKEITGNVTATNVNVNLELLERTRQLLTAKGMTNVTPPRLALQEVQATIMEDETN